MSILLAVQDARPWPNYDSDYRPMVQVAKNEGLPVICANAPRRYVSLAGRNVSFGHTSYTLARHGQPWMKYRRMHHSGRPMLLSAGFMS